MSAGPASPTPDAELADAAFVADFRRLIAATLSTGWPTGATVRAGTSLLGREPLRRVPGQRAIFERRMRRPAGSRP